MEAISFAIFQYHPALVIYDIEFFYIVAVLYLMLDGLILFHKVIFIMYDVSRITYKSNILGSK